MVRVGSARACTVLLILVVLVILLLMGLPRLARDSGASVSVTGLELPATGVWNGFNQQLNVVECSNLSGRIATIFLSLQDYEQQILGERVIEISSFGSVHMVLNGYEGIEDNYGTYVIDTAEPEEASPSVTCHTMFYRKVLGETEYAFSVPVRSAIKGVSYGVYNSMNPEGYRGFPAVHNWLSVYNPGKADFSARVQVYSDDGALVNTAVVENLPPGDRRDIALGHEQGQVVGLYRIVPEDVTQGYGAYLSRYSPKGENTYNFGFSLLSEKGYSNSGPLSASTMGPATNWGEVVNISDETLNVEISVYSRDGEELHREEKELWPRSQYHVPVGEYIGEWNVGYFQAKTLSGPPDALLAQSLYYGKASDDSGEVVWAYASQAKGERRGLSQVGTGPIKLVSAVNTFEGAANWLKLFSTKDKPVTVEISLHGSDGSLVAMRVSQETVSGSKDIAIHEEVGSDFVGQVVVLAPADSGLSAEMVRVIPPSEVRAECKMRDYENGTIVNIPVFSGWARLRQSQRRDRSVLTR